MEQTGDTFTYYVFGEEYSGVRKYVNETNELIETFKQNFNASINDVNNINEMVDNDTYKRLIDINKYTGKRKRI